MEVTEAPISKIPIEVLARILIETCNVCRMDCESEAYRQTHKKYKDGGITVASVCRKWRSVAFEYAEIWSFISIPDYPLDQIQHYLIRSKKCGLTVIFAFEPQPEDYTYYRSNTTRKDDHSYQIIHALRSHMGRIRYLALYNLNLGYMANFLHLSAELRYLHLSVHPILKERRSTSVDHSGHNKDIIVSHSCSALSEVVLTGIPPTPVTLRMDTLLHLTLEDMTVTIQYLQELLEKCSDNLESLDLSDIRLHEPANNTSTVQAKAVDFTRLDNLRLDLDYTEHIAISHLFNFSEHLSVHSVMRSVKPHDGSLDHSMCRHFSVLNLEHGELKMSVNAVDNCVLLSTGNYVEKIEFDPTDGAVWKLCREIFKNIRNGLQLHLLTSFELNFLHSMRSENHALFIGDEKTMCLEALKSFLKAAGCLKCITFCMGGGLTEKEAQFVELQNDLITLVRSLTIGPPNDKDLVELEKIILKGFIFTDDGAFAENLKELLSKWKKSNVTLCIDDAHWNMDSSDLILRLADKVGVGSLYIDGVRKRY